MSSSKYFKNKIITKYVEVIKEYFELMTQSTIIKGLANPNDNLFIGINAVHRVFEYILIKTNNIDTAYYYSQKACYSYLEYLEQINKSELASAFTHMDAIICVYKQTIFDIYDGENSSNNNSSAINNLLSLNTEKINITQTEVRTLLNIIFKFTKILFFWDNTQIKFNDRHTICNDYLFRYLIKFEHIEFINSYLELIQEKVINLTYNKYNEFLQEILICIEKKSKKSLLKEYDINDFLFNKIYIERHTFNEKIKEDDTKELVKWLFV